MRKAFVERIAGKIYDGVTLEMVASLPHGEASGSFVGLERTVNGMPVTTNGRRPIIGVDNMNDFSLPYQREPAHVSAKIEGPGKLGQSAVRLSFARPEGSTALYGPPISVGLDFGVEAGEEGEPTYSALSVVLSRRKEPGHIEVQQGDDEWRPLETHSGLRLPNSWRNRSPDWSRPQPRYYEGHEALFLGGVLQKVLVLDGHPTQPVFDPGRDNS